MPRKTSDKKAMKKTETNKWSKIRNKTINENSSYTKDDKILRKVEKYVDKNREKTSQEILEKKKLRPERKYQEADLEVMISRINNESRTKGKSKEASKRILYIMYAIIVVVIIIFILKYLSLWNL